MCCAPMYVGPKADDCPSCGWAVDEDGDSCEETCCEYTEIICTVCGYCPCDGSC